MASVGQVLAGPSNDVVCIHGARLARDLPALVEQHQRGDGSDAMALGQAIRSDIAQGVDQVRAALASGKI